MTFVHYLYLAVPAIYFLIGIFGALEQKSKGGSKRHDPKNLFKQGAFVLLCAVVAILVDMYVFEAYKDSFTSTFPRGMAQTALLPALLFIAAKLAGGTKPEQLKRPTINRHH